MQVILFTDVADTVGYGKYAGTYKIATEIRNNGYTCQVVDLFSHYSYSELEDIVTKFCSTDTILVGFSCSLMEKRVNPDWHGVRGIRVGNIRTIVSICFSPSNLAHNNDIILHINNTMLSGFVEPKIKSWDFRLSNTCNLKCRICNSASSSSIAAEQKHKTIKIESTFKKSNFLDKQLFEVDNIYFAGGEPLLMQDHYDIIHKLIAIGRSQDVSLQYNSNVTNLTYKNEDIFTLWTKFKSVSVSASIDAYGLRAEYARHGKSWEEVEINLRLLQQFQKKHNTFNLTYSATVSIFNIWHLTDLHTYLIENKFLENNSSFNFSPLILPKHQSINILPRYIKDDIIVKIKAHTDVLNDEHYRSQYNSIINFLTTEGDESLLTKFYFETKKIDRLRGENFMLTFPEYKELFIK